MSQSSMRRLRQERAAVPTYEYQCEQGHRFEKRQGFNDEPLRECVECGQPARRLISVAPIIFKGSGWYITDSRSSSGSSSDSSSESKSETNGESTSAAKADDKGGSKGESKAETKSEGSSSKSDAGSAKAAAD